MKRRRSPAIVYVAPSRIEGVGSFTDRPIAKGELVRCWDGKDSRFIPEKKAHASPDMALIKRFGIRVRGGYWSPLDFVRISAGWYTNHSEKPNLGSDDGDVTYYALRNIRKGEELTIDYRKMDDDYDNLSRDVELKPPARKKPRSRTT